MKYCPNCMIMLEDNMLFCTNCGASAVTGGVNQQVPPANGIIPAPVSAPSVPPVAAPVIPAENIQYGNTLHVDYYSIRDNVKMLLTIVNIKKAYSFVNGQTLALVLQPGIYELIIQIGNKRYRRVVNLTQKEQFVSCGWDGRPRISITK